VNETGQKLNVTLTLHEFPLVNSFTNAKKNLKIFQTLSLETLE